MPARLRSVTVKFSPEMFEQIKIISSKRGETISDTIRYLITRGLDERISEQNTELLTRVVREQINEALASYSVYPDYAYPRSSQNKTFSMADSRRLTICRRTS